MKDGAIRLPSSVPGHLHFSSGPCLHQLVAEPTSAGCVRLVSIHARTSSTVSVTVKPLVSTRVILQRGSSWVHADQRTRWCRKGHAWVMTAASHRGSAACIRCHDAQLKVCWVG